MNVARIIEQKLAALEPSRLELRDDSALHAGHEGAKGGGGNNGGGGGNGGGGEKSEGSTSALDLVLERVDDDRLVRVLKPRKPPRRLPPKTIESVSIKDSCTCDMRTVRSGGQLITIRDCYKISGNTLKYCEPLAQ